MKSTFEYAIQIIVQLQTCISEQDILIAEYEKEVERLTQEIQKTRVKSDITEGES